MVDFADFFLKISSDLRFSFTACGPNASEKRPSELVKTRLNDRLYKHSIAENRNTTTIYIELRDPLYCLSQKDVVAHLCDNSRMSQTCYLWPIVRYCTWG